MAPKDKLWQIEEHTRAKHMILRKYLDAWLPIVAGTSPRVILIDGYAGPGEYLDGSKGSPLVMIDALLEHSQAAHWAAVVDFVFIEERKDRADHLDRLVASRRQPGRVNVYVVNGQFNETIDGLLEDLGERNPAPIFMFVDPFGYSPRLETIGQIAGYRKCEALTYLPIPFITRFVTDPTVEDAISRVLGTDEWKVARGLSDDSERRQLIHDVFRESLLQHSKYVRSFEVQSGGGLGYHLFFATNHRLGLEKMKDAMWRVDPAGTFTFRDSTTLGQEVLFASPVDTEPLGQLLRDHFGTRDFAIEEAEDYTLVETPYKKGHLKRQTLAPLERARRLEPVLRPPSARAGTYPAGTVLRFVQSEQSGTGPS